MSLTQSELGRLVPLGGRGEANFPRVTPTVNLPLGRGETGALWIRAEPQCQSCVCEIILPFLYNQSQQTTWQEYDRKRVQGSKKKSQL